jgi:hypothetical protein
MSPRQAMASNCNPMEQKNGDKSRTLTGLIAIPYTLKSDGRSSALRLMVIPRHFFNLLVNQNGG